MVRQLTAGGMIALACAVFAPIVGERDRRESNALATLRAILSGETAYARVNGGDFDTLECLTVLTCVPDASGGQNAFLAPDLAGPRTRSGYRFEFHAGPTRGLGPGQGRSQSAMTRFAVVAVPKDLGRGQLREFCTDDRRTIYSTLDGKVPRVEAGRCLDTASPVR